MKENCKRTRVKRLVAVLLCTVLALCTLIGCSQNQSEMKERAADIAVLYTGDVHCAVEDNIGYAGLAAYKSSLEADGCEVLLVDTGDAIQGAAIGSFSTGSDIIEIMNRVGYDAMALGNHEFDYGGPERVAELAKMADFPLLSVNFTKEGSNDKPYPSYTVLEADGVKLAFVGVSTPETLTSSTPAYFMNESNAFIYGFLGEPTGETLYRAVQDSVDAARKEGADYVVVLAHLGIEAGSEPFTSNDLIANTNGIDVVLDGHSHSVLECERVKNKDGNRVLLSSTGSKLENIGLLYIDKNGNITTELVSGMEQRDEDITALIAQIKGKYEEKLNTVVGVLDIPLVTDDPETGTRIIRNSETNLGDFCADAYRAAGEADIAFINGGGIRADLKPGEITYGDVLEVNPFGNLLCKVSVSGQTILDALEFSADQWPEENGGFLHVSGMAFEIHADIPSTVEVDEDGMFVSVAGDRRVKNVTVGGEALDPAKKNTLVSVNYILKNFGNGYSMFSSGEMIMDEFILDADALTDYISGSEYDPANYADPLGAGRIVILNGTESES